MNSEIELKALQTEQSSNPQPSDLESFLPWACDQLQLHFKVAVTKTIKAEYQSTDGKTKKGHKSKLIQNESKIEFSADHQKEKENESPATEQDLSIHITTAYDKNENLSGITFVDKTPQELYKLISLITNYHSSLYSITAKRIDQNNIYGITKILDVSNVTDLCLDNCFMKEGNYHILLENPNRLRYLSVSRCKLNDIVVEAIMLKLVNPLPASKTLAVLNLSFNFITDVGAKHIANTLKSNRMIHYLNLCNNMITDEGASDILGSLLQFPISSNDLFEAKSRNILYQREKQTMIEEFHNKITNFEKERISKKNSRVSKRGKSEKELLFKNDSETFRDRAVELVEQELGVFADPYIIETIIENDWTYCIGNNTLCYLNIAYNNMSYLSINKLLDVLSYQKFMNRQPIGLLNVCIEGNNFPEECEELHRISNILDAYRSSQSRRSSPSSLSRKSKMTISTRKSFV